MFRWSHVVVFVAWLAGCTGTIEAPKRGPSRDASALPSAGSSAMPIDSEVDGAFTPQDAAPPDAADGGMEPELDAQLDAEIDADVDATIVTPPVPPLVDFEPAPGTFTGASTQVTLTALHDTASVFYTLDGTYPSQSSLPYTTPINLTSTSLLRVAVYEAGSLVSVRSVSYVQLGADVEAFTSNLPLVVVHMLGTPDPDPGVLTRVPAIAQIHDCGSDGRASLLSAPSLDARIGIKVRGRSTHDQPKHSYTFEIRNQIDDDDEDARVLDMPRQSDWVLYAPYTFDRALMRNAFWYALSRSIGRYAPRTRFVEVYLASSGAAVDQSKYLGVYVLTETIKRDAQRVDVEKLEVTDIAEPEVSGGYVMRVDDPDPGETAYQITGVPEKVEILYPDTLVRSAEQTTYLTDYLNAVGRAFEAPSHTDATTGKTVEELVDVDGFIDHHILSTYAKNPDAFRLSSYMYKERGQRLVAGPLWDCDRCMGSYDGRDADPTGWNPSGGSTQLFDYGWWGGMFTNAAIETRYWARFGAVLSDQLSSAKVLAIADDMAAELQEAAGRNTARWPEAAPELGVFQNEVDHFKDWLDDRSTWATANNGMR